MNVFYAILDTRSEKTLDTQPVTSLPSIYQARIQRMRSASARVRTRAGLWLLTHGLRAIGHDTDAVGRISLDNHGRPTIAGAPAFNISHSGNLVACALAADEQAVGLDVEAHRPQAPARLTRLMSARERAVITHAPERFFDFWCAREATVKASGQVGLARIRALTLHGDHARLDDHDWPLQPLELGPGFAACLASDRPITNVTVQACVIAPTD